MNRRRPPVQRPPVAALILAALAVALFAVPLAGLAWRAPWSKAWEVLTANETLVALRLSLWCSILATAVCVILGVPLAWALARTEWRGRNVVRAVCTLSMVLPPVVGGVALFASLGRRGLIGRYLDQWFDIRLPYTTTGVVVAQVFVAMPFLVIAVDAALTQLDPGREAAARTLGASSWFTFRHVTLPAIRPALLAGAVLAWARAFGEFGATMTFAGNFPGTTRTLPLAIYLALESNPESAVLLALAMVAVSFAVLLGLRSRWLGAVRPGGGGR